MESLLSVDSIVSLLTLTFLEIVLGIDNIIFISITASRLPKEEQGKARNIGLMLAMVFRIILLFGISVLISLQQPFTHIDYPWLKAAPSGQAIILFVGGLFLLYKATNEIFQKLEGEEHEVSTTKKAVNSVSKVVTQIALINLVFSIDSILTAIGLTNNMPVMIIAVVVSALIMMGFSGPVGRFVNNHPSLQVLGLSFLIMIGFMLIAEASHDSELTILGNSIGQIPKGYLYFSIAFSLFVEFINIQMRKRSTKKVEINDMKNQAEREGII
ncbi:TerC family protein [Aquirufa antheringensis]|uniref:TerC family protein n=1 Tax=Aquirufa antheringensis TaxID=2516559 RepID=UPI001F9BEACB|nr:TerC family protein [Pseudarcicella sp. GAP-15]